MTSLRNSNRKRTKRPGPVEDMAPPVTAGIPIPVVAGEGLELSRETIPGPFGKPVEAIRVDVRRVVLDRELKRRRWRLFLLEVWRDFKAFPVDGVLAALACALMVTFAVVFWPNAFMVLLAVFGVATCLGALWGYAVPVWDWAGERACAMCGVDEGCQEDADV